jgi:hypothetical protein
VRLLLGPLLRTPDHCSAAGIYTGLSLRFLGSVQRCESGNRQHDKELQMPIRGQPHEGIGVASARSASSLLFCLSDCSGAAQWLSRKARAYTSWSALLPRPSITHYYDVYTDCQLRCLSATSVVWELNSMTRRSGAVRGQLHEGMLPAHGASSLLFCR